MHLYGMRLNFPNSPAGQLFEVPIYKTYLHNQTTYLVLMDDTEAERLERSHGFEMEVIQHKEQLVEGDWMFLPREGEDSGPEKWNWPSYFPE